MFSAASKALAMVGCLASCSSAVEGFGPVGSEAGRGVQTGDYDVSAVARLFGTSAPVGGEGLGGAVFLRNATACEVVEVVLVGQLAMDATCNAQGGSLNAFTTGNGPEALATAVFLLRNAGFTVTERGNALDVSGSGGAGTAVGGLPPQPGADERGSQPVDGTDIAFIGGVPTGEVVFRYTSADFAAIEAFALTSSLPVIAVQTGVGVALIGAPGDVEVLEASVLRRPSVLVVPLAGRSYEAMTAVLSSVSGLTMNLDPDRGELIATGDPAAVSMARSLTRALVGNAVPVVADVAFLSHGHDDLQSFGIEPGVSVNLGQLALRFGNAASSPFSLVVDQLNTGQANRLDVRPSVTLLPGVAVSFSSGSSVPIVGSIDEEDRQSIEFVEVGTDLDVTCAIVGAPASGVFRCDVLFRISEVVGAGVVDNPVISERRVSTSVQLRRGDVVFLAAFSQEGETRGRASQLGFPSRSQSSTAGALSIAFALR